MCIRGLRKKQEKEREREGREKNNIRLNSRFAAEFCRLLRISFQQPCILSIFTFTMKANDFNMKPTAQLSHMILQEIETGFW